MKRWITRLLSIALVLATIATPVFAAGPRQGQHFTDSDGDGVCDNRTCWQYVDENQDGICDNQAYRYRVRCLMDREGRAHRCDAAQERLRKGLCQPGNGYQFSDENGDGICDNQGIAFEDADDDGVCDHRGSNGGNQGEGRGRCRGQNR